MPSPYKRSGSGYSETDEAGAKRYGELVRIVKQDSVNRKAAGEKGFAPGLDSDLVKRMSKYAQDLYKKDLKTTEGRELSKLNMDYMQGEANKVLERNSRAQYEHEREAGDPNALRLSFQEWKKL
jgi:hypothetical protein